jgi:putative transposase
MHLTEGEVYHVFNRGNNKQRIFLCPENYFHFLQGVEKYLSPCCDILAWCLMPNHFHFLIHANDSSVRTTKDRSFERQQFSQGIKMILSSCTKAINKQGKRTGSLFQQKTKQLFVSDTKNNRVHAVFHYIHQKPFEGLVRKMEDWEYNSFKE